MTLQVVAVSHRRRLALFSDDQVGEILTWWTPGGEEHEDPPPNPASCMVQHPSGERVSINLAHYDRGTKH